MHGGVSGSNVGPPFGQEMFYIQFLDPDIKKISFFIVIIK